MKRNPTMSAALLPALAALALLVAMPREAAEGARSGLSVCAQVIVPSLLPFFILSGLLSALRLPDLLAHAAAPVLRLLGIAEHAAAPLLLGLTGGYPLGAAAVGEMVRSGTVTPEEGALMLPWCNNTGPAFIIGAAGAAVFGSAKCGFGLYLCHIASALSFALLSSRRKSTPARPKQSEAAAPATFSVAFPAAVGAAVTAIANICGYVVFFSVLTALARAVGLFSALSAQIARITGTGLQFSNALLCGILELGNGIGAMQGLPPTPRNLALAAFVLGFGGLSVHCQTLAVLAGTNIKCARHFVGRIIVGALGALWAFILFTLLRI